MGTMDNVKKFYKNFDESREKSIGAIGIIRTTGTMGTIGAIGNFVFIGNMGFIRTMGTMENRKISFRTLMKVEKYL